MIIHHPSIPLSPLQSYAIVHPSSLHVDKHAKPANAKLLKYSVPLVGLSLIPRQIFAVPMMWWRWIMSIP